MESYSGNCYTAMLFLAVLYYISALQKKFTLPRKPLPYQQGSFFKELNGKMMTKKV